MPPLRRFTIKRVALAAALAALAAPVMARDEPTRPPPKPGVDVQLKSVERELERSRDQDAALAARETALQKEVEALRARLVEAAAAARAREQAVVEHRQSLARLEGEEHDKVIALDARRRQLSDLLMALARHARRPPEAMVAMPSSPEDTIRAALLLAAAVPELEAEAASLRTEIEALEAVRKAGAETREQLERESRELAQDRSHLESLVGQKSALQQQTQAERRKAQADADRLAREAHDIKELMERVEAERQNRAAEAAIRRPLPSAPAPAPPRPGTDLVALPRAIAPVSGRIVAAFGDRGDGGTVNRGVTLEAVAGARVLAPFAGRVVYAGPFRDYGQLLIIEHGEGYHLLLAGFGRIDSALGESVLAGEPIGIVDSSGGAVASRGGAPARIYVELRRNGRPIDPTPWLGAPTDKVSG